MTHRHIHTCPPGRCPTWPPLALLAGLHAGFCSACVSPPVPSSALLSHPSPHCCSLPPPIQARRPGRPQLRACDPARRPTVPRYSPFLLRSPSPAASRTRAGRGLPRHAAACYRETPLTSHRSGTSLVVQIPEGPEVLVVQLCSSSRSNDGVSSSSSSGGMRSSQQLPYCTRS